MIKKFKAFSLKKKIAVFVVLSVVMVGLLTFLFFYNGKAKVDTDYLNALVKKSSELTTAELNYTGMTKYTDKGVAIINKADFIMVYDAKIRAGIDVEQVKIIPDDEAKIIYLDIPKAQILDVKIDTSSIKYFDQGFALFNTNEKEDNNAAVTLAEKEAKEKAPTMGILELADQQSETLIKGILANALPDGYTIKSK